MIKFTVGQNITDKYGEIWTIKSRTEKTVIAIGAREGEKRFRLSEYFGVEIFRPYGVYSMSPTVFADSID